MSTLLKVGSNQAIKSVLEVKSKLVDDCVVQFNDNEIFPFDLGLDTGEKQKVVVTRSGGGKAPVLVFKGNPRDAKGVARSPQAVTLGGDNSSCIGIEIDCGDAPNIGTAGTSGVRVSGKDSLVQDVKVGPNCYMAFESFAAVNPRFVNLYAHDVVYGLFSGKGNGDEQVAKHSTGVEVTGCDFQAVMHVIRKQMTDSMHVHHNKNLDGSKARCCMTDHDLAGLIFEDNPLVLGNMGHGPLGQGNYLSIPPGPRRDFCMKMRCIDTIVRRNNIRLINAAGVTFDMGVQNILYDSNTIYAPTTIIFNCTNDTRYSLRGTPTGTVTNNTITAGKGATLLKGFTPGVKHSNNHINALKVD